MRILYGVVGEGMGHAMRSRVVLDELCRRHQVQVVVSGRAYDYLAKRAGEQLAVKKIWGYSMVYEDNEVQRWKTLLENAKGALSGVPGNVRAYFDLADKFAPEVVISDFETWSYLYARNHRLPVISVDNMQILNRCEHAPEIVAGHAADFAVARGIVKAKLPGAFHYLVTTFFYPVVSKKRTTLHPPILRPEILAARERGVGGGDHLLVYQTSTSNAALPGILRGCGVPCRVYGLRRDIHDDVRDGNIVYRPFSEGGFIDDLRTARGVVAGGGFTLMGEAVYLGRPMLSEPVRGQFEQVLNARYLQALGYGRHADALTRESLGTFLEALPSCEQRLAAYHQDGNRDLLSKLDEILTAAVAAQA